MKRSVLPILAVLGLAWAAFACASASANVTVLCKANEQPCKANNIYPEGTAIVAETTESSGPLKIATNFGSATIECPSKLEATVGAHSGETQLLSVSSWSLGNSLDFCDAISSNNCGENKSPGIVNAESLPYTAEANWTKYENSIAVGNPAWHLICKTGGVTFLDCTFTASKLFHWPSTDHHSLVIPEQGLSAKSGSACPSIRKLSATFKISKPETPIYVSYAEPPSAPSATTKAATGIKATSATLNGTVNPKEWATTYWFEYGTTTSYGSKTSTSSAGSGTSDVAVSKEISGLTADTTYHYRLVAENENGLSKGNDMTVGPPVYRSSFGEFGKGEGQFGRPAGVAIDPSGNLWVVDVEAGQIEKWSPSGKFLSAFGEKGSKEGQFSLPSSVALDSSGNVWVADTGNNRIEEFTSKGEFLLAFGEEGGEAGQFVSPKAVAIDPEGHVWVGDTGNERLQEFDAEGNVLLAVEGYTEEPTGIAFSPSGATIYVADAYNDSIEEFYNIEPTVGTFYKQWNATGADTLAVDAEGHVWVVDEENDRVQEFTMSGEYITQFGTEGSGPGEFNFHYPSGIAVGTDGNIWVSDSLNHRVQKWSR